MNKAAIGIVELKACPFPHEAKRGPFIERDTEDFWFVRVSCADCGCAGPYVSLADSKPTKTEEAQAIRLWNTRTPDPIIMEMVEALEDISKLQRDVAQDASADLLYALLDIKCEKAERVLAKVSGK